MKNFNSFVEEKEGGGILGKNELQKRKRAKNFGRNITGKRRTLADRGRKVR